jgi:hypothetical protein
VKKVYVKDLRRQLEDNIKVDFREIVFEDVKCMELAQGHVQGDTSINFIESSNFVTRMLVSHLFYF